MTSEKAKEYQRGYHAGRKRAVADAHAEIIMAREREFWERAVLTVAPYFMGCPAWERGEKKLNSLDDRVELCVKFADAVVTARRKK
jgi:hypothetical protein